MLASYTGHLSSLTTPLQSKMNRLIIIANSNQIKIKMEGRRVLIPLPVNLEPVSGKRLQDCLPKRGLLLDADSSALPCHRGEEEILIRVDVHLVACEAGVHLEVEVASGLLESERDRALKRLLLRLHGDVDAQPLLESLYVRALLPYEAGYGIVAHLDRYPVVALELDLRVRVPVPELLENPGLRQVLQGRLLALLSDRNHHIFLTVCVDFVLQSLRLVILYLHHGPR